MLPHHVGLRAWCNGESGAACRLALGNCTAITVSRWFSLRAAGRAGSTLTASPITRRRLPIRPSHPAAHTACGDSGYVSNVCLEELVSAFILGADAGSPDDQSHREAPCKVRHRWDVDTAMSENLELEDLQTT